MVKCKHCVNEANKYFEGYCITCYANQVETQVVRLSKDACAFIDNLILREASKAKEPMRSNMVELANKFNIIKDNSPRGENGKNRI